MITFHGELILRLALDEQRRPETRGGRCQWDVVGQPFCRLDDGTVIFLERGSTTDLASVPRFAWSLLPPDGPWVLPAAFHDDLYRKQGAVARLGHPASFTRLEADQILLGGMAAIGVSPWKRELIYRAVRLGGAGGWGR